ncbi:MAG: 4-(cytidine 5'-diphospho)-2-C-methyl-D-erythritol kinase [Pseudomonadota bacterium]
MISELAPAKINLFLHVGPLRPDRLHDLRSVFVFADYGDIIEISPGDDISLTIDGPFADDLGGEPLQKNLVWKAADRLREAGQVKTGAKIKLIKNLPIAAGIGGGSADAAAALRGLQRLWKTELNRAALHRLAFSLGADVPACLSRVPVEVSGAGEVISPARPLPPLWVCLVNPRVPMATGAIFRAFDGQPGTPKLPLMPVLSRPTVAGVVDLMANSVNDLEVFAKTKAPVVGETVSFLARSKGCIAARMSGSGATCFGLFASKAAAQRAAIQAGAFGWWAASARLFGHGSGRGT